MFNQNVQQTNPADKAQEFMHSKKQNVKRAQKQGAADGSKVPTSGGRQPRPQPDRQMGIPKGEVGTPFNGGQPPQFGGGRPTNGPEGFPGPSRGIPMSEIGDGNVARPQPTPGPGSRPQRPTNGPEGFPAPNGPGGRPGPGIPRGEVGTPFNGGQPPQFGGGSRPQPPGGRTAPGRGRGGKPDRQIGIPRGEVGTPFNGGQPPQFGGGMPQFGGGEQRFGSTYR